MLCFLSCKVWSQTQPTASDVSICGGGTVTLSATGGAPAGGTYYWYANPSGGPSLFSSASGIYTTVISATTTFYVAYKTTGFSSRTAVTATVNPAPALSTAPSNPTNGLYLSYPFTGNANDISGNNNNGTVQNGPQLTTDRYGSANSAYGFNGSNQYISTAKAISGSGPQNFSISVWFKTSSAGGLLVGYSNVQTGQAGQFDRHIYMSNTGALYFGLYSGATNTINTTTTYADGNWHHVVATCSTTSGSNLYVDGALQATSTTMTASESHAGYWRIGYNNIGGWPNNPTNYYFNGSLDDIAVYNTAITPSQVYTLYGAGSPPVCAGSSLSLQANTVLGATYSWSGPNGYASTSQNPIVSPVATTSLAGTYTLTVTGSNGCTSTSNVIAVVNSASSAFTATSSVNTGTNATVTYTGTDPAGSAYSWDFNGGTPSTGTGQGPFSVQWATTGNKTISLTVTNANGCSSASTQPVSVTLAAYGNYAFSKQVTLNTTSLGITSNLANFPALLSITDNDLIISGTCTDKITTPNGPNYDFAFVSGGTELKYQVESYNQTTGTLLVWVQIPSLTYASNNTIGFYYGSTSPPVTHDTPFFQATWPSDYRAVFHFNESSYTGSVTDGTTGGHTGTANNMTSANLVTGKIGTAYSFNGSNTSISSYAVTLNGSFTLSAWVKLSAINVDQKIMTNQTSAGGSSGGYKLGVYTNNYPETESGTAGDRGSGPFPAAFGTDTWHHVQGVYSGTGLSTYVDGVQYETSSTSTNPSATSSLYIGVGEGGAQYYFNGIIDEPRISTVAKTADWIKAEYVDQNSPATFTSVSSTRTVNTTNAASVPGALTYTWTGASGTSDLTNANNWSNTTAGIINQLPSFTGKATFVIPSGLSVYPVLTANESVYGLTIANGASFSLNGFTLSVGCNIYNSSGGQIMYGNNNSSGITFNGSAAAQTYTGTNTNNTAQLGSLTLNNSSGGTLTISGGPVDIYNTLTVTKGNLVVGSSPAALTLKSTATNSASVAAMPLGSGISGNVSVERFITGGSITHRAYRLLSSPVNSDGVNYSLNYLKNSIILTGTNASGGFDNPTPKNPTLYLYRENMTPAYTTFTNSNFRGISDITLGNNTIPSYTLDVDGAGWNIPIGNGYLCFFRGDRAAGYAAETLTSYVPNSATLTATGKLNQGTINVKDWFIVPASTSLSYTSASPVGIRGYNLIGNPYASTINFEKFNRNGANSSIYGSGFGTPATIYFYNPTTKQYCSYKQKTNVSSVADTTSTVNPGTSSDGYASNMIASGQGFFIQATTTGQTFSFRETAKTATQPLAATINGLMGVPKEFADTPEPLLRVRLVKDSVNTDEVVLQFNNQDSTTYAYAKDALDLGGNGAMESLSVLSSDSIKLCIHGRPLPKIKQQQVIPLLTDANATGLYQLKKIELNNLPPLYDVWLKDSFMKDSLDLKANDTYSFNIDKTNPATFGATRFSLVIRQNQAYAFHLLNFTATKVPEASQVQLVWVAENEQTYTNFTIERSTDNGKTFDVLGGKQGTASGRYSLLDKNPVTGLNLYRLKTIDVNNTISYSNVIPIQYSGLSNKLVSSTINVYPNPAKNTINLSVASGIGKAITYSIMIVNNNGLVIKQAISTQPLWQGNVSDLRPGTYVIQVTNNTDKSIVGKTKFVKL